MRAWFGESGKLERKDSLAACSRLVVVVDTVVVAGDTGEMVDTVLVGLSEKVGQSNTGL